MLYHGSIPRVADKLSEQSTVFKQIHQLYNAINLRVQAETNYESSLIKYVQKMKSIQPINQYQTISSTIILLQHNGQEKIQQVSTYRDQLKSQNQQFHKGILELQKKIKQCINDLRNKQHQLKKQWDDLEKLRQKVQQNLRHTDQKFILNEIRILNKSNIKYTKKTSQKIFNDQINSREQYQKMSKKLDKSVKKKEKNVNQKWKQFYNNMWIFEQQFIDFVKKITIHEISYIRNLQYDKDNFMKNSNIFKDQTQPPAQQPPISPPPAITLKPIALIDSTYHTSIKKLILSSQILPKSKISFDNIQDPIKSLAALSQSITNIQNQYLDKRQMVISLIESFRTKNIFKFQKQYFLQLAKIFFYFAHAAYKAIDVQLLRQIIYYSSSYYYPLQFSKISIFDLIKKLKLFKEEQFWRQIVYFAIKYSIQNPIIVNERQLQLQELQLLNVAYSTLLTNSLQMISCQIDKVNVKNTIAKIGKVYGLNDLQVNQILIFIEKGAQNYQKIKNNLHKGVDQLLSELKIKLQ